MRLPAKEREFVNEIMFSGGNISENCDEEASLSWAKQRVKALERDNYACTECGMTEEEHYEEFGCSIDVHHITSRIESNNSEKHNLSNLITVCQFCHVEKYDRDGLRYY